MSNNQEHSVKQDHLYAVPCGSEGMKALDRYEKTVVHWQSREIRTGSELAKALRGFDIAFAYHSGRIENDQISLSDVKEIFESGGLTSYTGDLRTLLEIRNLKTAHELLLASFGERRPLDERLLLEFQRCLTQGTYDARKLQLGERPGEYKKHDFVTGKAETGAAPEDVEEEVAELLAEMKDVPKDKALTAAAYLHAKFENIHPFADGNGRTGRLIMNYFLLLNDYPPIIIHEEDRKDYYLALEAWDERQELGPLLDHLKKETVRTWRSADRDTMPGIVADGSEMR